MSAPVPTAPASPPDTKPGRFTKWHHRALAFCLILFAFELGVFLVVFPWLKDWDLSRVALHSPAFSDIWMSSYFRGALSGLGLLDIYIALAELIRLLKSIFAR